MDQPGIERNGDDIFRTEFRTVAAIGGRHLVGHFLARKLRQCVSACNFHLVVDCCRVNVERAAEYIGKPEHIVDLVRIVGPAGGNNCIITNGSGILRRDFRVRIGHRKDNRIWCHDAQHVRCQGALDRNTQEDIRTLHCIIQ